MDTCTLFAAIHNKLIVIASNRAANHV